MVFDPMPRGQHEGDNAVDDDHAGKRGDEIDPSEPLVPLRLELVPAIEVKQRGGNLEKEEDPLDGPAPHKDMNQVAGGCGTDEADGEPYPHAADGSEDNGEQDEETGMSFQPAEQRLIAVAAGLALGQDQEQTSADRKVRDEYVEAGHQGHQQASAKSYIPNRKIHDCFLRFWQGQIGIAWR